MNLLPNQIRTASSALRASQAGRETAAVQPAIGDGPPPLNLDELRRRCMGRLDLVDRLLASFERRFPNELLEIEQALDAGDLPRMLQLVHQLKGASANISAPVLHRIIKDMESAGRANDLASVAAGLKMLESEWERFTEFKESACLT